MKTIDCRRRVPGTLPARASRNDFQTEKICRSVLLRGEYLEPTFSLQTLTGNDKESDTEGGGGGEEGGGRPSRDVSVTEYFCKYLAGKQCWPSEKIQHKCGALAAV